LRAHDYLRETARLTWPRAVGGQCRASALLSGAYIGMDRARGQAATRFTGMEVPPIVTLQEAGRYFVLRSSRAGAIDVGTPVFFRKIAVGQVVSSALDESDDFVTTRIFVRAPYDERVHESSRFWDASGFTRPRRDGVVIDTESTSRSGGGIISMRTSCRQPVAAARPSSRCSRAARRRTGRCTRSPPRTCCTSINRCAA
jgi:paraquat-inducible protein B